MAARATTTKVRGPLGIVCTLSAKEFLAFIEGRGDEVEPVKVSRRHCFFYRGVKSPEWEAEHPRRVVDRPET